MKQTPDLIWNEAGIASPLFCCLDAAVFRKAAALFLILLLLWAFFVAWKTEPRMRDRPFLLGFAAPLNAVNASLTAQLGAISLRGDIPWSQLEKADGKFEIPLVLQQNIQQSIARSIQPMGLLVYGHAHHGGGLYPIADVDRAAYRRYVEFAVGSLGGISIWEIWNEWNLAIGMPAGTPPGRPEDYVRLLAETYAPLKSRFPEKVFLGGAVAGIGKTNQWTERACQAGLLEHLDGFSFHPYFYWMPKGERVPEMGLAELVDELEATLAKFPRGKEVPLYVTELGWPTYEGDDGVTFEEQANWLARSIFLLRTNKRVRGVWIYTLRDGIGGLLDRESHFGLLFADGTPKPAWYSFRDVARVLKGAAAVERISFADSGYEDEVAGVRIIDGSGRESLVLWAISSGDTYRVKLRTNASSQPACSTVLVGSGEGPSLPIVRDGRSSVVTVSVTARPIVVKDVEFRGVEDVELLSWE